ncbi:MAG TPA: hypothetical protein DEA43_03065 [Candidatus Moranbacteria bacterium]|nr:hypothetical protein [Candidatus Moranbacteria bacterium]HBT45835.1 hypothetical protein [Candidatus Moranbacteria bacterium]
MRTHPNQVHGILKRSPAVKIALEQDFDFSQSKDSDAKIDIKVKGIDRKLLDDKAVDGNNVRGILALAANSQPEHFGIKCIIYLLGNKNKEILSKHNYSEEKFALADVTTWDCKTKDGGMPISGILSVIQHGRNDCKKSLTAVLHMNFNKEFKVEHVPSYKEVLCEAGDDEKEHYFLGHSRRDPENVWQRIYRNLDDRRAISARQ